MAAPTEAKVLSELVGVVVKDLEEEHLHSLVLC